MLHKALLCVALAVGQAMAAVMMNLTVALASNNETSMLATAIAGNAVLASALSNMPNVTFFASSNDAITRLGASLPDLTKKILSNAEYLTAYTHYHLLPGAQWTANFSITPSFPHSAMDEPKYSNVTGGQVVEIKTTQENTTQITTGFKNTVNVVIPDIPFSGGVIHVVDSIFSLPEALSSTAQAAGLTAFLGGLIKSGLLEALDDTKDLTIFAPTNAAFEAVGSAFVNISTSDLAKILSYHIVKGSVTYSTGFHRGDKLQTITPDGQVAIDVSQDALFVNQARVTNSDIFFGNGVIHIIDSVLSPANATTAANPSDSKPATAFAGARSGSVSNLTHAFSPTAETVPALTSSVPNVLAVESISPQPINSTKSAAPLSKTLPGITGSVGIAALSAILASISF